MYSSDSLRSYCCRAKFRANMQTSSSPLLFSFSVAGFNAMSNTVLQSVEKENTLCNYLLAAEVYSLWNLNRSPAFTLTFLCFSFQLPSKHGQRPAGILRCRHTFPAAYVDVQKPPPRPLLRTQMYHLYKSCRNTTCLQPIYCHRCGSFT